VCRIECFACEFLAWACGTNCESRRGLSRVFPPNLPQAAILAMLALRRVAALRSVPALGRMYAAASTVGTRVEHAKNALCNADAVCFDVDSTVINVEGIDELAAYLGCGEAVAQMTANAMGGSQPFHEALAGRLALMQPSRQKLEAMMSDHPMDQACATRSNRRPPATAATRTGPP
jgi:hypothetical protein